jgi:hypothetical protein
MPATKPRHKHTRLQSRLRHTIRYDRSAPKPTDRFTYGKVIVDGKEAMQFFMDRAPFMKQPVRCSRDQALYLVRKLNRLNRIELQKQGNQIITRFLREVAGEIEPASL